MPCQVSAEALAKSNPLMKKLVKDGVKQLRKLEGPPSPRPGR